FLVFAFVWQGRATATKQPGAAQKKRRHSAALQKNRPPWGQRVSSSKGIGQAYCLCACHVRDVPTMRCGCSSFADSAKRPAAAAAGLGLAQPTIREHGCRLAGAGAPSASSLPRALKHGTFSWPRGRWSPGLQRTRRTTTSRIALFLTVV